MTKFKKASMVIISLLIIALIFPLIIPNSLFCKHNRYIDGICERCSKECIHAFGDNGKCSICDIECKHYYNDGICNTCNITCVHTWENGVCVTCKDDCSHNNYENGICTTCEYECLHETHTQEKGICLQCQEPCFHDYVNGICVICGRTPVFYTDFLPDEYYEENENQGNIETIAYTCRRYPNEDAYIDREMIVWTPYGYNENTKYNVLVLMHGGGGTCKNWVTRTFTFGERSIKLSNIYDCIVEKGNVAPFIIVSIPAHNNDKQIANELRDTVLPYIVENYSTWAESSDVEDIVKARDHFGIGGLSQGSFRTLNAGMSKSFDLFGNYMALSGNGQEKKVEETITNEEYKNLSVRCFFSGCGTSDALIRETATGYKYILECSNGRFVEGSNAWYQDVAGGHDWKAWSTEVVNALQVMF